MQIFDNGWTQMFDKSLTNQPHAGVLNYLVTNVCKHWKFQMFAKHWLQMFPKHLNSDIWLIYVLLFQAIWHTSSTCVWQYFKTSFFKLGHLQNIWHKHLRSVVAKNVCLSNICQKDIHLVILLWQSYGALLWQSYGAFCCDCHMVPFAITVIWCLLLWHSFGSLWYDSHVVLFATSHTVHFVMTFIWSSCCDSHVMPFTITVMSFCYDSHVTPLLWQLYGPFCYNRNGVPFALIGMECLLLW